MDLRGVVRPSDDALPESQDLDDFCWPKPSWSAKWTSEPTNAEYMKAGA
jgi:hypothetical protein